MLCKLLSVEMDSAISKFLKIWILNYPDIVRISEIANQNPWWKHGDNFVSYDRHLSIVKNTPSFLKGENLRRALRKYIS